MAIIETKDYVFAPKTTLVAGGIVTGYCLGTKKYLFFIPLSKLEGAGDYTTTTKYRIDGQSIIDGLKMILNNEDMTIPTLEAKIFELFNNWDVDQTVYAVDISTLSEFDIKIGFFSKGIYYKTPTQNRRSVLAISGKQTLIGFKNFYGR